MCRIIFVGSSKIPILIFPSLSLLMPRDSFKAFVIDVISNESPPPRTQQDFPCHKTYGELLWELHFNHGIGNPPTVNYRVGVPIPYHKLHLLRLPVVTSTFCYKYLRKNEQNFKLLRFSERSKK